MSQQDQTKAAFKGVQDTLQRGLEATGSADAINAMNQRFEAIYQAIDDGEDYIYLAQETISHLFTMHPNLSHVIPRGLLWRLGGSCMHHLTDAEIEQFSAEDEANNIVH